MSKKLSFAFVAVAITALFAFAVNSIKSTKLFDKSNAVLNAVLEAITAIVVVIMIDVYIIGNDAIINSSSTIGAVVVPILQAVLLVVAILIAIALLRSGITTAKASK